MDVKQLKCSHARGRIQIHANTGNTNTRTNTQIHSYNIYILRTSEKGVGPELWRRKKRHNLYKNFVTSIFHHEANRSFIMLKFMTF